MRLACFLAGVLVGALAYRYRDELVTALVYLRAVRPPAEA